MNERDIHILIIADNLLARTGLAAILESQSDYSVIGQSTSDESVDTLFDVYRPDVVLVDLSWNTQSITQRLRESNRTDIPLVALIGDEEDARRLIRELRQFDVYGVLLRERDPATLFTAIKTVLDGLVVFDPNLLDFIVQQPVMSVEPLREPLTPREMEVIQNLAKGLTNKAIARKLNITDHTVKFHVNAIMSKLNAQSRTEAVVRATQLGLIIL